MIWLLVHRLAGMIPFPAAVELVTKINPMLVWVELFQFVD
ncbi:MAG: hypothetical protein RIQ81_2259 [Pseudomonadota bacterium]